MLCCENKPMGLASEREPLNPVTPRKYYCGFGKFRPKWLQACASAKFITFILCVNALVEGSTATGFTSVVLSTIEKRYKFSSLSASLIVITFDITVLCVVTFISYFGAKAHKPRWLGISSLIQGTGALLFALPQFMFGKYEIGLHTVLQFESCEDEKSFTTNCDHANTLAYTFFILGRMVIAIGASSLFTVGTSFIDDIVHPKYVSIHLGIFFSMGIIGPAMGYGLGGGILSIYVDPWESTMLKDSEPGWVGAWWLCFIVGGIASYMVAIPFLMLPRELPDSHIVMEARRKEMTKKYKSKYGEEKRLSEIIKSFPTHLAKLLKNQTWLCITIGATCLFFAFDGIIAFAPKYFEAQYRLKASSSSLLVGSIAIPAGGLGVLVGATIVHCVKSKGKKAVSVIWITCLIALPASFVFLARCNSLDIAGINMQYVNSSINSEDVLTASCNQNCNCTSSVFEPVCGADGVTYVSPCRAGCYRPYDPNDLNYTFVNCSCVSEQEKNLFGNNIVTFNSTANVHQCGEECWLQLVLFTSGVTALIFFVFIMKIPIVLLTLRCVADEQRTLALGVQSVIFRTFGSVPGPIFFGIIFDTACIYWQNDCGVRGNCWVYDNYKLSLRSIFTSAIGISLNFVFSFVAWIFYRNHNRKEEDYEEISSHTEEESRPLNVSIRSSTDNGSKDSIIQTDAKDLLISIGCT